MKILLCDRTFVLDTHGQQAVKRTTHLHEVRSVADKIPAGHPRKWPARTSKLPCRCMYCADDPDNNKCVYANWRDSTNLKIGIYCLYPEEAETWVGVSVIHEWTAQKVKWKKKGTVIKFLPSESNWEIKMEDGSTEKLKYIQLCKGKARFDKTNRN